jgi:NADP-dependent 3-hydroxy acid dehydrogenase YdfG
LKFSGKIAVVTGAGSGIGRALTAELTSQGAAVAASDIDRTGLEETVSQCQGLIGSVTAYDLDVADRAAVIAHAEKVVRDLGRVNLVVNNAGVSVTGNLLDLAWDDIDWLLGINLGGVISGSKAFLPHLIASGDGHLVNVSSMFGLLAVAQQSAYVTAKFGVRGFTETLRQEMIAGRYPVSVHSVHPGMIQTNIARSGRFRGPGGDLLADQSESFDRIATTRPEKVARVVLAGIERNKPRIIVGPDAHLMAAIPRIMGARYVNAFGRAMRPFSRMEGRRLAKARRLTEQGVPSSPRSVTTSITEADGAP